jgi:hypothetical protein
VLPKIEETQSRVRKLEEKERLAEQEDRYILVLQCIWAEKVLNYSAEV